MSSSQLPGHDTFRKLFVDAGMCSVRMHFCNESGGLVHSLAVASAQDLHPILSGFDSENSISSDAVFITGTLRDIILRMLGKGTGILPAAALWAAAQGKVQHQPLVIIEVSASGYCAVGVDPDGSLHDNLLAHNARCGAGSGINLDRILQKLDIPRNQVDIVLRRFLGVTGAAERDRIRVRTDRCGVFASSATVSDKNQGIPVDHALAVTLKSEVHKVCKLVKPGFSSAILTGGVFQWKFARDCAADYLVRSGITDIQHDADGSLPVLGLMHLEQKMSRQGSARHLGNRHCGRTAAEYPGFLTIKTDLGLRYRYDNPAGGRTQPSRSAALKSQPVFLALDVGSSMAKLVLSNGQREGFSYKASQKNAGDTVETIKRLFKDLIGQGVDHLHILGIGITGSARYQVSKVLASVYPSLADRIELLVENYAHVYGSMALARRHVSRLKSSGVGSVNDRFCILVDVGGEDTKISTISLEKAELFDNAMNLKCSAGTGSLMDTMSALFDIPDVATAADMALRASKSYAINATCSVFLMEHARALQASGIPKDEILAAATWAVVDNMAKTLWSQIELPKNAVALLHGQTMLSESLPIAVASRLQTATGSNTFCVVPPWPGHRACLGLVRALCRKAPVTAVPIRLKDFTLIEYEKTIIECRGIACGETTARCSRSRLTGRAADDTPFVVVLGGCSAVNEMRMAPSRSDKRRSYDTYGRIMGFADRELPRSQARNRLVIPKGLAVSEWALFFSRLFTPFDIPVHVDRVREQDIVDARPHFRVDTCAPHIGMVGQMLRLSREHHMAILAPQLEFLPVRGNSLGRTCTVNQGAFAVAKAIAEMECPSCRIHLFHVDLRQLDLNMLAHKLLPHLSPVYGLYGISISFESFLTTLKQAYHAHLDLKMLLAQEASRLAAEALSEGRQLLLVMGREYTLNPGIYDSHVGKLLRDKAFAGIPAHVLDADCNPSFEHLYWRNAHLLASLVDAAAHGRLHTIITHEGLRNIFAGIERSGGRVPVVQVSSFLCGPDSVTNPLIDELAKNRPHLRIQSDAIIKELAHLENRMNTFATQLRLGLHAELSGSDSNGFDMKELKSFVNREPLDRETDAIYFPTLSDNRLLTAVVRGAGFTCVDNYDESYTLESAVRRGRSVTGDAVCAPLAAVYGDVLNAIDDFKKRKKAGDPEFLLKKRLLIFNNKGMGPCRQGQYVEAHKLFLRKSSFGNGIDGDLADSLMHFLVGHENKGFNVGFPQWAFFRGIQSIVLQGVLHQLLAAGSSRCLDSGEYEAFLDDYRQLKCDLGNVLENFIAPSPGALTLAKKLRPIPALAFAAKFFAYRFHQNPLWKPLRRFSNRWCRSPLPGDAIRIHVDGEVYMRTSQFEEICRILLKVLGFRRFELTYAPVWSFLEYKLAGMLMRAEEGIRESIGEIRRATSAGFRRERGAFAIQKVKRSFKMRLSIFGLRRILAAPLYSAARLHIPEPMTDVLGVAGTIVPTRRPGGELMPFVGETILKLRDGYDLILNVAPEGCMVSSMGEVIAKALVDAVPQAKGKVEHLFSQQGDVDEGALERALLTVLGPQRLYRPAQSTKTADSG